MFVITNFEVRTFLNNVYIIHSFNNKKMCIEHVLQHIVVYQQYKIIEHIMTIRQIRNQYFFRGVFLTIFYPKQTLVTKSLYYVFLTRIQSRGLVFRGQKHCSSGYVTKQYQIILTKKHHQRGTYVLTFGSFWFFICNARRNPCPTLGTISEWTVRKMGGFQMS